MKRLFGLLLILVIMGSVLMTSCQQRPDNSNINYKYNKVTKELTIKGNGDMPVYDCKSPSWAEVEKPLFIVIKGSVTSLSDNAFNAEYKWKDNAENNFKEIQTVELGASVKRIGKYAFKGCGMMRSIDFTKKLQKIGEGAFANCGGLSIFNYPSSTNTIEDKVFKNCIRLRSLGLGDNIKSIGNETFYGDKELLYFELPDELREIGAKSFYGCEKIMAIYIPEKAVRIGEQAFYNCRKLKTVIVPESVKSIGDRAFGFYSKNGTEKKVNNLIIRGKEGSTAENYAKKNGFKFIKETHSPVKIDGYKKLTYYKDLKNFGYIDTFNASLMDTEKSYYDISAGKNPFFIDPDYEEYGDYKRLEADFRKLIKKEPLNFEKYEKRLYKKLTSSFRKAGDYIISDYKDGVCLNKVVFDKKKFKRGKNGIVLINIPEEIEGKKVVKLGCYIEKRKVEDSRKMDLIINQGYYFAEYITRGFLEEIPDGYRIKLNIPSSVKEISYDAFQENQYYNEDEWFKTLGYIAKINVDKNNPYYTSENGVMYTKDRKWLLFARPEYKEDEYSFTVPDSVEYIADTHICDNADPQYTLKIGANVKKIYSEIPQGECGVTCNIKTEKGSNAEKWYKKYS